MTNINTAVYKWLVRDGIAYNVVTTQAFKAMMCVVTGLDDLALLSRETFNNLLDGDFGNFAESVKQTVEFEASQALSLPFLNLLHDAWSSAAKVGSLVSRSRS